VQVGKEGLNEGLLAAVEQALLDHELIKVRLGKNVFEDRKELAGELARSCGAELTQVVGNTMLLYRQHPDKPTIKLPKAKKKA
jgi:RNA-binding protein